MDDTTRNNSIDPWDRDSYETGSTCPPKNRRGIIALLLGAVIFLVGIVSALSLLNIRLSDRLEQNADPTGPLFFATDPTGVTQAANPTAPTEVTAPNTGDVTLDINKSPTSVENIPQAGGLSYQQIYTKNIDSVVSVTCVMENGTASGTGVVLSKNGYIVTNCHVVAGAKSVVLSFSDKRELPAAVVGADTVSDLAVLYVQAEDLSPAEFGSSDSLRVGDAVAAIGDPLGSGLRGTMTDGIVSAINRDISVSGRTMTLIQTNAALNSGNSGGPLINCYGQVIGINTMKIGTFADSAGVEGIGFAIPSTTVKEVVDQLIRQGYVSGRPDPGFSGETVSELQQRFYRCPAGVLIRQVTEGSHAEKVNISMGDILISLDGQRITTVEEMNEVIFGHQVGDTLEAVIYRGGRQYAVSLTLEEAGNAR